MDLLERRRNLLGGKKELILFEANKLKLSNCSYTGQIYEITRADIEVGEADPSNAAYGYLCLYNILNINKFKSIHVLASCYSSSSSSGSMEMHTSTNDNGTHAGNIATTTINTITTKEYYLDLQSNITCIKFFVRGRTGYSGHIQKIWLEG